MRETPGRRSARSSERGPASRETHTARRAPALLALAFALAILPAGGCGDSDGEPRGGGQGGPGAVADQFETVGSFEAGEAVTVVSEIDGLVTSLPFREGAPIDRGGPIARLDDAQYAAEVKRTEALRDQARASFERVKAVVEARAGSAQDLDDAAAALKVAEANLDLARTRLAKTRVTAPFDGITGARQVSPGAFLRAGTPITELASIRQLRVNFSAPERLLPLLQNGTEISVTTTAYPGYAAVGRVAVVEPVVDPATRTARVVARMDNPDLRFRPGMSARVRAVLQARENALTVPSEAVFVEGSQSFVFVVQADSTVKRAGVTLGTRLSDRVEIVQGLEPGQRVVRAGHQKLFDGARVAPIESSGRGEAGPGGGGPPEAPPGAGGTGESGGPAGGPR